ncbi:MAG TPA: valine--tRNA ligase [Candidatus Desulfovibrio intestinipullorum]|uniref:Valine--tRNA ligase n=1 Tax=Candidatus Desulfovibrio intestinipullorum TaxID=2838536 RepID=A0A9D1PWS0_9BACT|nr:valine--tRNA ligase [Candidatus Desulfovibrio intestinipullorum]
MSDTLPKGYEPRDVEARWRSRWRDDKTFSPDPKAGGDPYCIVIPPPNVTGALHIGHALNLTLIDSLCRHYRQKGRNVLWIPGTDHAGIATQNVVEKTLAKEGKRRQDLGREKFIERVWQWREEYGHRILSQIEAMGCSVDWSRLRFTLDEGLSRAVRKVFVQLYNEGLIYRGKYIINWCSRCHTALADDEVEHSDERGHLWSIRYHLQDSDESIIIATTRPETIPGDTAICVHPEDERYTHLIGKTALVPVLGRAIPIIADKYVDREFGTGALKVTPCHDHNDWALGKTHNLEFIQVIDEDGVMKAEAGKYAGLSKQDCRKAILADIEAQGDLVRIEDLTHSVGHCYRCHTVVEPHVSEQWFVATTKLAPKAKEAIPNRITLLPETWTKTYYHWLDTIRDWCISRQIWWGHRIPAWTCNQCHHLIVAEEDPTVCPECGSHDLHQDEDVLDTWFSSALWPFSTLGWPDKTEDLARWYPTAVLVTGFDILFFWVARMIMMGEHFMGNVPFRTVYLHALVRDAQGKKMSKSTGNVIDPVKMIENYGCDALRFTLTAFAAMGRDIKLSEERIEGYRHFVNKLWNAARFTLMNLEEEAPEAVDLAAVEGLNNRWILHRLELLKKDMDQAFEEYRFNDVAQGGYKFLWSEFCDWYLELVKPDMQSAERKAQSQYVLYTVLKELLILLHPIMPFVTAEIWQALPGHAGEDLATMRYPEERPGCLRPEDAARMEFIQGVIVAVRTIKAELDINPSHKVVLTLHPADAAQQELLLANESTIVTLARLERMEVGMDIHAPKASASSVVQGCQIIVPLKGNVDLQGELARLAKEMGKLQAALEVVDKKLSNESFVTRAKPEIVQRERDRAAELKDNLEKLTTLQARFLEALENGED